MDDQDKALAFYTNVLGFKKKQEIPMGPYRWLSVVSPEEPGAVLNSRWSQMQILRAERSKRRCLRGEDSGGGVPGGGS